MVIDWVWGLLGGLMIGAAGALFLLGNGRVMGASGILGGAVDGSGWSSLGERLAFLGGLIGVPFVVVLWRGAPDVVLTPNLWALISAGLLVGLGTRMANGCTSGHGVCGLSRFSLRGLVATIAYILAGGVAVVIFRHLLEVM